MPTGKRESPAGFHFYGTYSECRRKFFFRYILGYKPRYSARALLFGGVIHNVLESYYTGSIQTLGGLTEDFDREMEKRRADYESSEDYTADLADGVVMLTEWYRTWHEHDKETYDIIEVEQPYEFSIGPNEEFRFTVRPDVILRHKRTGRYFVKDIKTTRYSDTVTFKSQQCQDQMTSYLWAIDKMHPEWSIESAIVDCMYKRGKVCKATRDTIYRNEYHKAQFEVGMFGTISEVTQKSQALEELPAEMLFPRDGSQCAKFGCDYIDICRSPANPERVPPGFVRDEWTDVGELKKIKKEEDLRVWR